MSTEHDTTDETADEPATDDDPEVLSFEEGRRQTKEYADKTKVYEAHLPEGGVWRFEFKMVDRKAIVEEHTTVTQTRHGTEQDTDYDAVELAMFCEGVVDAPEGFPLSPTKLQREDQVVKDIIGDVADAIAEFSSADEETIRQFQ